MLCLVQFYPYPIESGVQHQSGLCGLICEKDINQCSLFSCSVAEHCRMEVDDVVVKDQCMKVGQTEKLITPSYRSPTHVIHSPEYIQMLCVWAKFVCVCENKEKEEDKIERSKKCVCLGRGE